MVSLLATKGKKKVMVGSHGKQCIKASPQKCSLHTLTPGQVRELANILSHSGYVVKLSED